MPPSFLPKLFLISILSSIISATFLTQSYSQCLDDQKSLLLELRNEVIFNSSISEKLVQWNQTDDDCCNWYGVECDGAGNVISLELDDEGIAGGIGNSSSLFRLKYLKKLNLAYNNFNFTHIPRGIHNLTYLTHLNLSHAPFGGQVPLELSLLRRLVSLDISSYDYGYLELENPNLEMLLQNLTELRELYLDGAYFSGHERREWSHIVSSYLPDLTSLSLRFCGLSGPRARSFWRLHSLSILRLDKNNLSTVVLDFFANFSSLTTLSLANCGLKGYFPTMIFHIPTLQNLDLSNNDLLSGSIPPFTQSGSLKSIVLRSTNFSGSIPSSISNLTQLIYVDLSENSFTGSLPSTLFGGLSNLAYLDLDSNSFSGNVPQSLFSLPSLLKLQLRNNNYTGQVEEFPIVNVSNIISLDLSRNRLEGPIPDSFFQLQSLESIFLSENLFSGTFQLEKIQSLPNLTRLDLSRNNLSVDASNHNSSSYGFPQLKDLRLASCNLNDFPHFIKDSDIRDLDLSNNRISGEIPSWIWGRQLEYLDLSQNLLTDLQKPFHIPASLRYIRLSNNRIAGEIPSWIWGRQLEYLDLSQNLLTDLQKPSHIPASLRDIRQLDLSNNRIAGEIPSWIWERQLEYLDLSHNLLTDLQKPFHIPASLRFLSLDSNQLWGELHLPIVNFTSHLEFLFVANNSLSGSIPTSLCNATFLSFLDLSVNKLSGNIPPCLLENTENLASLDLSRNSISGSIPDNFSQNCVLQYFDLSNNTIEGKIPKSLKRCKRLLFMNVGNNIINDCFPCMQSSTMRVLVLRSNRFHGEVTCHERWPELQIVDISSNNFSGSLESINFSSWGAMVWETDVQLRHDDSDNYISLSSGMTLIMKGIRVVLVKLWIDFTTVDLSCNNFQGEIPNAIGDLASLHFLNLSHNALNGSIPKSFGKLGELESLDLSGNQLTGTIPNELAGLTSLSLLNLSYNKLVGKIPNGRQLQTFSADFFKENSGLCGFPLNISCSKPDDYDLSPPKHENVQRKKEIEWEYVSAALGYVVGLGSIVWLLLFCRSFREKYFGKVEEVVEEIFDGRNLRRRRARRVVRTQVRRQ